jgi:hypothetical protein
MNDSNQASITWLGDGYKTVYSSPHTGLSAKHPMSQNNKSRASLSFRCNSGNPGIVFTCQDADWDYNKLAEMNYGRVDVGMKLGDWGVLMNTLQAAIDNPSPNEVTFELSGHPKVNGERSKDIVPVLRIAIGRNEKGVLGISAEDLTQLRLPRTVFRFGPLDRRYFRVNEIDGKEPTAAEMSERFARALVEEMRMMYTVAAVSFKPAPKREFGGKGGGGNYNRGGGGGNYNRGGNGGGNYNRGNGGGGGYSRPEGGSQPSAKPSAPADDDDDIPY